MQEGLPLGFVQLSYANVEKAMLQYGMHPIPRTVGDITSGKYEYTFYRADASNDTKQWIPKTKLNNSGLIRGDYRLP